MKAILDWLGKHKISTHTIAVIATGVMLYYRINPDFHAVVDDWQRQVPKWFITLLVAAAWLYSWYRNGQKDPATNPSGNGIFGVIQGAASKNDPSVHSMIRGGVGPGSKIAAVLLCCLALSVAMHAQVPTPSPTPSAEPNTGAHFEVSTSYERLTSGANATVISARLPLTPRYSFVYSQYQIPSAHSQVYLAEGEFREKLSHLIKSKSAQINLDNIQVFARTGIGTKRDDQGNNPIFAWGIHGGAEVAVGQIGGGTVSVGLKVGLLGVPRQPVGPKIFILGSSAEVAPGVTLRF